MKTSKSQVALWLLVFSLISFDSAEFFHNHNNLSLQDNDIKCSACLLHSALQSADIGSSSVIITPLQFYSLFVPSDNNFAVSEYYSPSQGRSPPLVSHI